MSQTSREIKILVQRYQLSFFAVFFLLTYWMVGFDGITFSDDVFYILAGENFWKGTMEVTDYHFSSRWGAYIPAGLIGFLFGYDPHTISAISLISYISTYLLLLRITEGRKSLLIMSLWFCTPVYFLHFLTKVYPDSLLVFWTCLVPFAAIYRQKYPVKAGILLVLGLFLGFLTKETIVFLAPLPVLLFYFDIRESKINLTFYWTMLMTGLLLLVGYLSYFWVAFGDPLYRISSINAGHYISEYTYADKGIGAIIKRLTILPFQTFVERAYWPWLVLAIPGLVHGLRNKSSHAFPFAISLICILVGFWFMSSTLEFYNPIYLNPRHLIILIPILAYLIGFGWEKWQNRKRWKFWIFVLLALGVGIALLLSDWKMAAFHALLIGVFAIKNQKIRLIGLTAILLIPAMYSIYYQHRLKQYATLTETLQEETQITENKTPIYTHSFIDFSKEILLSNDSRAQELIIPLYQYPGNPALFPQRLKVLIYDYYRHAYPDEQEDIDAISSWLNDNYRLLEERKKGNVLVQEYELK